MFHVLAAVSKAFTKQISVISCFSNGETEAERSRSEKGATYVASTVRKWE